MEAKKDKLQCCGRTFMHRSSYLRHVKSHELPETFNCIICDMEFKQRNDLEFHMSIHMASKPHMCEFCGKGFEDRSALEAHVMELHTNNLPKFPELLDLEATAESSLNDDLQHDSMMCGNLAGAELSRNADVLRSSSPVRRVEILKEKNHVCEQCGLNFPNKPALKNHITNECTITKLSKSDTGPFPCSFCGQLYKNKGGLASHERIHKNARPQSIVCDICGYICKAKSILAIHRRRHTGEKPFKCSTCGEGFADKSSLIGHIRSHTQERPFVCSECGKGFNTRYILRKHEMIHGGKKPLKCKVCGKRFRRKYGFENHVRRHTGETPFPCPVCSMKFRTSGIRMKHIKEKHNENYEPYKCSTCDKKFMSAISLRKHAKSHFVVQPFTCKGCGAGFLSRDKLRSHIKFEHNSKIFICQSCDDIFVSAMELTNHRENHCKGMATGKPKPTADAQSEPIKKRTVKKETSRSRPVTQEIKKLYFCSKCGQTFTVESDVEKHMQEQCCQKSIDTDKTRADDSVETCSSEEDCDESESEAICIKLLQLCVKCGDVFNTEEELRSHKKEQHGHVEPEDVCENISESVPEKPMVKTPKGAEKEHEEQVPKWRCTVCRGVFTSGDNLERHRCPRTVKTVVRTTSDPSKRLIPDMVEDPFCPTDEKQFCCSICGKSFALIGNMRKHERRHAGIKRFKCDYCSMSFTEAGHLRTHTRIHTNETPFKCDACGIGFHQSSSLKYHKTHKKCEVLWPYIDSDEDSDSNSQQMEPVTHQVQITIPQPMQETDLCIDMPSMVTNEHEQMDTVVLDTKEHDQLLIAIPEHQAHTSFIDAHEGEHVVTDNKAIHPDVVKSLSEAVAGTKWVQLVPVEDGNGGTQMVEVPYEAQEGGPLYVTVHNIADDGDQAAQDAVPVQAYIQVESSEQVPVSVEGAYLPQNTEPTLSTGLEEQVFSGVLQEASVCETVETSNKTPWKGRNLKKEVIENPFCPTDEKPFCCPICGKGFRLAGNMRKHEMKHAGLRPYKCQYCDKAFKESSHLTSHMRLHTNETPFVCETCGRGFAQGSSLRYHIRKQRCKVNLATGEVYVKIHQCPECNKVFAKRVNLVRHMRFQHSGRKYPCPHCSKQFSIPSNLKQHIRVHTGECPYKCDQCGAKFRSSSQRRYHLAIKCKKAPIENKKS